MRRRLVAVIGGHSHNTGRGAEALAAEAGRLLAIRGYGVICGGYDGIMEAACRGNRSGGGTTVGILKGNDPEAGNDSLDIAIHTSMDVASNNIILWSACAVLAFEGRYGTLNEMALALDFGRPLLLLGPATLLRVENVASKLFLHDPAPSFATLPNALDEMEAMIALAQGPATFGAPADD